MEASTIHSSTNSEEMESIICNICFDEISDPKCTPCTHTFCESCYNEWMNQQLASNRRTTCAVCRHPLVPNQNEINVIRFDEMDSRDEIDIIRFDELDPLDQPQEYVHFRHYCLNLLNLPNETNMEYVQN